MPYLLVWCNLQPPAIYKNNITKINISINKQEGNVLILEKKTEISTRRIKLKRFKKIAPVWLQNLLFLLHPLSFEVALSQKLGEPDQHPHQGICCLFSKVMHSVSAKEQKL
jgi:hypothetical protein